MAGRTPGNSPGSQSLGGRFQPPPPRYQRWDHPNQVRCSRDHHLREDFFVIDHGGVRCKWKDPETHVECGEILYLLSVADFDLVFMAAVTLDEIREIRKLKHVKAILRFLGGGIPPEAPAR